MINADFRARENAGNCLMMGLCRFGSDGEIGKLNPMGDRHWG